MAKTLATTALDACQEIAQNTVVEGNTVDVSGFYDGLLQVWYALTNATAHTGSKAYVEYSTDTTGDEDWAELEQLIFGTGTTNLEVITNNPLSVGGTSITVASTTGYTVGKWLFLEDVSTFANSEWVRIKALTTDTSITAVDGVTRQHAQNSILNSVAGCCIPVYIPPTVQRLRVIYDNTFDTDGATIAIKAQVVGMTAY